MSGHVNFIKSLILNILIISNCIFLCYSYARMELELTIKIKQENRSQIINSDKNKILKSIEKKFDVIAVDKVSKDKYKLIIETRQYNIESLKKKIDNLKNIDIIASSANVKYIEWLFFEIFISYVIFSCLIYLIDLLISNIMGITTKYDVERKLKVPFIGRI